MRHRSLQMLKMSRLEVEAILRAEPYLHLIEKRRRDKPTGRPPGRPPGSLSDEEKQRAQESMWENIERLRVGREAGKQYKKWITILDDRTCAGCVQLNGRTIPIDDVFEIRGILVSYAPGHVSCRCVTEVV